MKLSRLAVCGLLLSLALPVAAMDAFEVAGRAPKNSLMVLAWVGADQAKAGFEKTHMGELYNEPEVNAFLTSPVRSLWQALMQEIGKDGNEKRAQAIEGLLAQLWNQPGFICVLNAKPTDKAPSTLAVAAEWMVDDPDNELRDLFKEWMKQSLGDDVEQVKYGNTTYRRLGKDSPVYLAVRKRTWILAFGDQAAEAMAKKRSGNRSFHASGQHKRAAAAIGEVKPWLYCAVNTERLASRTLDGILAARNLEGGAQSYGLGVTGMSALAALIPGMMVAGPGMFASGEFAVACEFDGKLITTTAYAKPASKNTWMLDYVGHNPIDAARLRDIPQSAGTFTICTFDASKMFEATIDTVTSSWSDAAKKMDSKPETPDLRALIKGVVGVDLSDELFSQLGDHLLSYSSKDGSEGVLIVDIKSREAIEGVLVQTLEELSSAVTFQSQDVDGARLFILSLNQGGIGSLGPAAAILAAVRPTIGITDNRLLFAADTNSVQRGISRMKEMSEGGEVSHPAAKAFLEAHKDAKVGMIAYEDEGGTLTPIYQQVAGLYGMVQMMKQKLPIRIDFAPLPPPVAFTKHMAKTTSWIELKDGVRVRHTQTGATLSVGTGIGVVAVATSVALPSLARARELAKRTVCMANMRGIGQAMYIYANNHDGKFPPDIETFISENLVEPKSFVCPSSTASAGELHACYEYIPGITAGSDPTLVVLYEINNPHQGEGGNVLYQDGHVEWVRPYSRVLELVEKTKQKLAGAKKAA